MDASALANYTTAAEQLAPSADLARALRQIRTLAGASALLTADNASYRVIEDIACRALRAVEDGA